MTTGALQRYGYVELPGQLRVEARLTVSNPDELVIGMPMELVVDPLCIDDEGDQVVTYAFAPKQPSTTVAATDAGDPS